jgi:hypothetical protein
MSEVADGDIPTALGTAPTGETGAGSGRSWPDGSTLHPPSPQELWARKIVASGPPSENSDPTITYGTVGNPEASFAILAIGKDRAPANGKNFHIFFIMVFGIVKNSPFLVQVPSVAQLPCRGCRQKRLT